MLKILLSLFLAWPPGPAFAGPPTEPRRLPRKLTYCAALLSHIQNTAPPLTQGRLGESTIVSLHDFSLNVNTQHSLLKLKFATSPRKLQWWVELEESVATLPFLNPGDIQLITPAEAEVQNVVAVILAQRRAEDILGQVGRIRPGTVIAIREVRGSQAILQSLNEIDQLESNLTDAVDKALYEMSDSDPERHLNNSLRLGFAAGIVPLLSIGFFAYLTTTGLEHVLSGQPDTGVGYWALMASVALMTFKANAFATKRFLASLKNILGGPKGAWRRDARIEADNRLYYRTAKLHQFIQQVREAITQNTLGAHDFAYFSNSLRLTPELRQQLVGLGKESVNPQVLAQAEDAVLQFGRTYDEYPSARLMTEIIVQPDHLTGEPVLLLISRIRDEQIPPASGRRRTVEDTVEETSLFGIPGLTAVPIPVRGR